jgi:hypothetical protein
MDENLTGLVVDAETGETLEIELSAEEIQEIENSKAEADILKEQAEAAEAARNASIRKMAEASGLTEAEIEALF